MKGVKNKMKFHTQLPLHKYMQCPSPKAVPPLCYFRSLLEAVFHQIRAVNIQKRLGTQHRKEVGENPSDDDTEGLHNDVG